MNNYAYAFILTVILEVLIYQKDIYKYRRISVSGLLIFISVLTGLYFGKYPNVFSALIVILTIYRDINLLRLIEGRTPAQYLRKIAFRSSLIFMMSQIVVYVVYRLGHNHHDIYMFWLRAALILSLILSVSFYAQVLSQLKAINKTKLIKHYSDRDLPDLTVAVPARNETEELSTCLESIVSSNYPKLEILVLDDCSQDRHTSDIIKSFAHRGAIFIPGTEPSKDWLAKNYAYKQLSEHANGQVILFCGVDTKFEPDTLRRLVELKLSNNNKVLSIMPVNTNDFSILSQIIQPLRYMHELTFSKAVFKRPPVLSTCWMIDKTELHKAGGFDAVSKASILEGYFARKYAKSYGFYASNQSIGLSSSKDFHNEQDTSIRTRYPQYHRRPELVLRLCLIEVTAVLVPIVGIVNSLIKFNIINLILSLFALAVPSYTYQKIVEQTYRKTLRWSWLAVIPAAIYDICLSNYSMWMYEFRQVYWKGRNICLPVLRDSFNPKNP